MLLLHTTVHIISDVPGKTGCFRSFNIMHPHPIDPGDTRYPRYVCRLLRHSCSFSEIMFMWSLWPDGFLAITTPWVSSAFSATLVVLRVALLCSSMIAVFANSVLILLLLRKLCGKCKVLYHILAVKVALFQNYSNILGISDFNKIGKSEMVTGKWLEERHWEESGNDLMLVPGVMVQPLSPLSHGAPR